MLDAARVKDTKPVGKTQPLAVVEKGAFEDWLMLSAIINNTSSSHDHVLTDLENKIAALNDCQTDETINPASPAIFCEAFQNQLDRFDLDRRVKQQIYKVFGHSLDHQLGVKDENGIIIAPNDFIPAAEYCGRISEIDRWVVNHVFDWMEANPNKLAIL